MKNGKKAALAVGIAVVFLAACSGKADEAIASGEIVAPEISSEDLLVSSLEYLLLDDVQEEQLDSLEQEDTENDEQEPEAAENTDKSEDTADEQPEPEEVQGETVTIYYGKGGSSDLKEETVILQEKTADELISVLAKHNIVSLDTKVLSFEERVEEDRAVLYLNLSKGAGEYLRTMSKEAECIIIASITNTFVENYDAEAIYLMIEGGPLITSNREYTEALRRCTPEELMKMPEEFDANVSQEQDAAETDEADSEEDSTDEVQSKLPLIQEKE